MKSSFTFLATMLAALSLGAQDTEKANPPEVQALVADFIKAFQSGDEAALKACWHSPEVFAKLEVDEETAARGGTLSPEDAEKEASRERTRREKDMITTLKRAVKLRELIGKHFGDVTQLGLMELDLDLDDDAPENLPTYDSVDLHLRAADGSHLVIELDEIMKVEGVWKFKGRLDDHVKVQLPDED